MEIIAFILSGFALGMAVTGWALSEENGKSAKLTPVIRCKDCYYRKRAKVNEKGCLICPASGMEITDRDYCSWAEVDV